MQGSYSLHSENQWHRWQILWTLTPRKWKISRRHMWTTMISHYLVMWTFDFRKHWNRSLCLTFLFCSCQHATARASEQVDQKIERVSQPERISTGGEQRNKLHAQALEHRSITTSTGYQQTDTAILGTSIYKTSTEYQQLDTTILGDMHTPMDGCISLDVLSI